jgi:hypothetical protein
MFLDLVLEGLISFLEDLDFALTDLYVFSEFDSLVFQNLHLLVPHFDFFLEVGDFLGTGLVAWLRGRLGCSFA